MPHQIRVPITHKVHIFENEGEFRVFPAVTRLDAGKNPSDPADDIEFVNHTDHDAVYYLGPGLIETDAVAEVVKKNAPKKKKAKKEKEGDVRISSYQVILLPSGKKAKANSDPVIIIDN
jgi:hypothetical protein